MILTDHKPLIPLFQGSASKPQLKIKKWILQLQKYQFQVEYKPGLHNPADYLLCHTQPATEAEGGEAIETEEYVRSVVERSQPLPISVEEITTASREDDCLQLVKTAIQSGDLRPVTTSRVTRIEEA